MNSKFDFKLVIVGDPSVGKTCLLTRFVENTFTSDVNKMFPRKIDIKLWAIDLDGETIKLRIIYTSGIQRLRPMIRSYFDNADGFIVTYDCTDLKSFNNVNEWMKEIDSHAPPNVNKLLVGNKCDLKSNSGKIVDYKTAKEYADQLQIPFFETSAKRGTNVEAAFVAMAKQIRARVDPPLSLAQPAKKIKKEHQLIEESISSHAPPQNDNNSRLDIAEDDVITDFTDLWGKIKKNQEEIATRIENKIAKLAEEFTQQLKETTYRVEATDKIGNLGSEEKIATVTPEVIREIVTCKSCQKDVEVKIEKSNSP